MSEADNMLSANDIPDEDEILDFLNLDSSLDIPPDSKKLTKRQSVMVDEPRTADEIEAEELEA